MKTDGSSSTTLKAQLLSAGLIKVSHSTLERAQKENRKLAQVISDIKNLYNWPWIFVRINNKARVRLIVDPTLKCEHELRIDDDEDLYHIVDRHDHILSTVSLEDSFYHCPDQLFFNLYTWCSNSCEFCPLAAKTASPRDTIARMVMITKEADQDKLKGIGITTGIPAHLSARKLIDELARSVEQLRKIVGSTVPIGVSPFACSTAELKRLHDAGANEVRINSESFNLELFRKICAEKDLDRILDSLHSAVNLFGMSKVSSNLIVGLGETDDDIHKGIDTLCSLGVIPTLYPLDPIPGKYEHLLEISEGKANRPDPQRLLELAQYHHNSITEYKLDPLQLKTMCPACSASHLMPGIDSDISLAS